MQGQVFCQLVPGLENDVLLAFIEELAAGAKGSASVSEVRRVLQGISTSGPRVALCRPLDTIQAS